MRLYMHDVIVSKGTIKGAGEGRGQTFILTPILLPPDKFIVHVRWQFLELLQTTTTTSHINPHTVIVVRYTPLAKYTTKYRLSPSKWDLAMRWTSGLGAGVSLLLLLRFCCSHFL